MDKKLMRKQMSEQRNALTKEYQTEYSKTIAERIAGSSIYKNSQNICVYQAFRNEVSCDNITACAFKDGKSVFVPITNKETMTIEFFEVTKYTVWQEGAYGILEPVINENAKALNEAALIFMPGLVFDKDKHRIGYGGGCYDKYLSKHTEHITAALCYPFQIVTEELPYEEHDILPDYIITNERIF